MGKVHEFYLYGLFYNESIVFTSSELIQKICEKFSDCSKQNARKIIQNAVKNGVINSTKPITFGHNQYAYYGSQFNIKPELLKSIIKENRPGLYRIINRMKQNGGVISYFEAFKLSGALIKSSTTKASNLSQLVKILDNLKLAKTKIEYESKIVYLTEYHLEESEAINRMKEDVYRLQLDCTFIPAFLMWLHKHNFTSNKNVNYRNKVKPGDGIIINNLAWDAVCYTNTTGFFEYIGDYTDEKKTLVVLDFKISSAYDSADLHGFYDRIQIFRNSVIDKDSKRKILPIIVSNEMTSEASNEIKKLHFLSFNLGTVFGERIYEIIQSLKMISFSNMSPNDVHFTEQIENILLALKESGQEDNLGNLKGELFERLMDKVIRTIYSSSLKDLKHSVMLYKTNPKTKKREGYEYDYLLETHDEYIIFELKGYKGTSFIKKGELDEQTGKPQKNTIKWFYGLTYPFAKKRLLEGATLFPKGIRSCYITTAQFDNAALEILQEKNETKDKPKDLDIYYDGTKLLRLLKDYRLEKEIKIINQYYKPYSKKNKETYEHMISRDEDVEESIDAIKNL